MTDMMPPIEKNKHEASIELLWDRIRIAIEQIPVPIGEDDNRKLADAEQKMWAVLDALTGRSI